MSAASFPPPRRRLRLGMVGGGRGYIGRVHADGAKLSDRWEVVAGALSSDPATAEATGAEWMLPVDRIYMNFHDMAECEAARPDGIEAVAITTPNSSHHEACVAFLDKGIDVICDKPLTTRLADALDLVERQRRTGLVFGVTHAFAAFAMVRQAREMVRAGELGRIRQVHVEFAQDWAVAPIPPDHKGGQWRIDPARAGISFTTADIGVHAQHLACFVTGMEMTKLRAELHVCGADKPLDDTAFMHVRYDDAVPGTLWVSQAAAGNNCALRIRVFGEKAGLDWDMEVPENLRFSRLNEPAQTIVRGAGAGMSAAATRFNRQPRGSPQALIDAWASLYTEFAVAIEARRYGGDVPPGLLNYPTVVDGAQGVKFIEAAVESHRAGGAWIDCRLKL
ncbi:Predicted dehydrogenase [Rhizobiales bacterium GAS191]|nr:Predicted dehydrogenase [Rhizobiales bacterium GAS191]